MAQVKKQKTTLFSEDHEKIDCLSASQLNSLCHDLFSRMAEIDAKSAQDALTTIIGKNKKLDQATVNSSLDGTWNLIDYTGFIRKKVGSATFYTSYDGKKVTLSKFEIDGQHRLSDKWSTKFECPANLKTLVFTTEHYACKCDYSGALEVSVSRPGSVTGSFKLDVVENNKALFYELEFEFDGNGEYDAIKALLASIGIADEDDLKEFTLKMYEYLGEVTSDGSFNLESLENLDGYEDDDLASNVGLTCEQIRAFRSAAKEKYSATNTSKDLTQQKNNT